MTTPNYNNPGSAGYSGTSSDNMNTGSTGSGTSGHMDDVSFSRTGQSDQSKMDTVKDTMRQGMDNAQDALGQLQAKANELTTRLINNVDVDDLTRKLEQQVREHPTRTLLMAAGAGFLLGRAAKR